MTCRECGHDDEAHSDRAFMPCVADDTHMRRCGCTGFTRQTDRGAKLSGPAPQRG